MSVMFILLFGCAAQTERKEPEVVRAEWKPMEPPRRGLRCWYSQLPDYGVSYCEADPNTTFGASQ